MNVRGIVHIGANSGQELEAYLSKGIHNIVFIEPIKPVFEQLLKHVAIKAGEKKSHIRCINELLLDVTGKSVTMNITDNNGESSSVLPMKDHLTAHPDVKVTSQVQMDTWSYDDLADLHHIDPALNFLNIDTQGAELLILKGMGEKIKNFDYVYIEVNQKELYEGNPMLADIDQFMTEKGLERKELQMTDFGWGDALYVRKTIHAPATSHPKPETSHPKPDTRNLTPDTRNLTPETGLGAAISETDQLLAEIRKRLTDDTSGSVADNIVSRLRTGFMNIINKHIKN